MTNFDTSVQLEWHYNEANYGKGPMDNAGGTMKRVVFRLLKSNKITINTAEELATEVSKAVPSIQPVYVSQYDEVIEPSFVKVASYIQGTLDNVKRSFNSNGVCFLEFHRMGRSWAFLCSILFSSKDSCVQSHRFREQQKWVWLRMNSGFSVLLARYDFMKNVLENNFTANFKDIWLKFRC